jgi:hypothetical protein
MGAQHQSAENGTKMNARRRSVFMGFGKRVCANLIAPRRLRRGYVDVHSTGRATEPALPRIADEAESDRGSIRLPQSADEIDADHSAARTDRSFPRRLRRGYQAAIDARDMGKSPLLASIVPAAVQV